ncbi:antireceptor [Streptococcus phage SW14]|uniref:Antireceptor n=1 Tax=Streptococcus phage SW14 TaxID=2419634 RepID=A0A3S5H1D0_9CAUD|nr:antireceptor [Streptococcus phage SW14]AYP29554.1 antireceptor [Streptococcus phage SW14]
MLLTIHDANLQKVGFIDNEKQETLNFYDDTWNRNLETASSTFEFTVSKKELLSDTANKPLYNQLNERSFVSFKYKGKTYLFNIMKTEENERWLRCYCENLNLELINEYANPYKADRPLSFAEYLDVFEIPQFAMVTLGINEISDQKRTLEWEGQETKLARLLSLANKFDAEVEFVTRLNDDSSINQLILNVYHKADDSHTGVGRIRGDIRLTFEKNIKSMTRKVDKTEIYTLVVPYGKSKETHEGEQEVRVYIDSLPPWEEKNDEGIVIFKQEGVNLYAPHAADLYPSTFGVSTQSNKWIRKDLEVDSDNPNVIRAAGIANLRKHAYPAITYEVDGFVDVEIGDTITIHDKGFTPALDIRARAVEQKISFSNPTNNKTTFGNFKELENRTSGDLRSVFEQMVENIRPYNILVSTDNGVLFKNNTGQSTLRPTLKRGNQVVNATYRFVIDGSIVSSGLTYTVKASDITKPTVITISAWVDNKEVASEEVTFVNVSDGKQGPKGPQGPQGPKGDRGNDGLPGKDGVGLKTTTITYGISDSDTVMPNNWSSQVPTLVKGKYLWTKTTWTYTDNSSETGYQKTYIAKDGNDGNDGLPGKDGVGLVDTTIEYLKHTDGQIAPNPKYYSSFNWKGLTLSQHLEHDWVNDLTLIKSGKPVKYTDLKVGELVIDRTGEIFPIKEIFGTEGDSSNPGYINLKPSIGKWSKDIPTVNPGEYLWTRTTWFYSDGTSEQGFSVAKMGEQGPKGDRGEQGPKGDQGIPGPKGADGRTQYTHIAYADTVSGSGFSQTDVNKAYIGMYQDFNAEDSKNPQDYRWSKWKGSDGKDGIPGKAGADGRTPYVHFAYADSADGQKGFSLTQTGRKRYLGVLTNFFKEDSTNPSDYTWNDTAGSISVGGRNLLVKTNQGITNWNWQLSDGDKSVEEVKVDGIRAVKLIKGSTAANTGWNFIEYNGLLRELIQPKSKYVLSFDVKPSVDVTFYATLARGDFNEPLTDTVDMPKALANQWNKVSCVLTSKETLPNIAGQVVYLAGMPTTNGNWVIIKNIKLEEGDIPTQWTPAIEDIQDEIDSKADAAMTIEQINALNERAEIIKAEMEAKASAEILNNWIKNYQDFVKANDTERAAAEKALISSSQRVSIIAKELGELSDRWSFIDSYMTASNDGLVIGKNDGSSGIMINPNGRISMYSAGEEVMYISQGVIHIENGIFSKTIQVGRYREEQYHLNPDMNVIRYVGGF